MNDSSPIPRQQAFRRPVDADNDMNERASPPDEPEFAEPAQNTDDQHRETLMNHEDEPSQTQFKPYSQAPLSDHLGEIKHPSEAQNVWEFANIMKRRKAAYKIKYANHPKKFWKPDPEK